MTLYLETPDGFVRWVGEPIAGVIYPGTISALWGADEFAAIGLFHAADPGIPGGKRAISQSVQRVDGVVTVVYELEDIPAPTPSDRPLSARQLRLGLIANGFSLASIIAVLDAIADPVIRDQAQVWWEFTPEIVWGHDWTQILIAMMGIPVEAAAAMWMEAWEIVA